MSGRIAVIGAGVAGLTAAHVLADRGWTVDVYERWPGLGGQAATLDVGDGVELERYYHHLFTSDVHIAGLYRELGIDDGIEWLPSSVAFFIEGRSLPFTTPMDLLRFSALSPLARIRMGIAVLRLQRGKAGVGPFETLTARDWIQGNMGPQAWEKVMGPLLRGKFGDRAEDISMAWLWSKLTLRRQIRGEEARGEVLGYPRDGFEPLFAALRDSIHQRGGRVLIDRPAARLERVDGGFEVTAGGPDSFRKGYDPREFAGGGEPELYDGVLATVPSPTFEQLLGPRLTEDVGQAYLGALHEIEYHAAQCLLLEVDRQVTPHYWTNVADASMPFVGLIEQANLTGLDRHAGRRFLYVANYVAQDDPVLAESADSLLEKYLPALQRVNPAFDRDWILRRWLFVEPHAQPIVTLGYRERMPPLQTGVPGLLLANTTQVYPEDRGTNYAVRLGRDAADALAGFQPDAGGRLPPMDVAEQVSKHRWYHSLELAPGVVTEGVFDLREQVHSYHLPERLDGMRALEVGTWDGFWAFELERRGATVVALDLDDESELDTPVRRQGDQNFSPRPRGDGFRLAKSILGSAVERVNMSVYDATPAELGTFDLVFCGSVIIHLRDQLLALERIAALCSGTFISSEAYTRPLELLPFPATRYVADRPSAVVYWQPNVRAWRRMLWTAGFDQVEEKSRFVMDSTEGYKVRHVVHHASSSVSA